MPVPLPHLAEIRQAIRESQMIRKEFRRQAELMRETIEKCRKERLRLKREFEKDHGSGTAAGAAIAAALGTCDRRISSLGDQF